MKSKSIRLSLLALGCCIAPGTLLADFESFEDGIGIGVDDAMQIFPDYTGTAPNERTNLSFWNFGGGINLTSWQQQSAYGINDGGITLSGTPVSVVLNPNLGFPGDKAAFEVILQGSSSHSTLFKIDGNAGTAAFSGVTLTLGGSPVLTSSALGTALNGLSTPPNSSAWTTAYVPRGTVSSGGTLALGGSTASNTYAIAAGTSTASGTHSFATGQAATASGPGSQAHGDNAVASSVYSYAFGYNAAASSNHAFAFGSGVTASGTYSAVFGVGSSATGLGSFVSGVSAEAAGAFATAFGQGSKALSASEAVLGRYNLESSPSSVSSWSGLDGLFRVGNGTSTVRSDALTLLKCGEITLTNQDWKAAVTADPDTALDDPASSTDKGGNALVVEGHAVLKGKVVIEVPQGDVSMGIYE